MTEGTAGRIGHMDRVFRVAIGLVLIGFALACPFAAALGAGVQWASGLVGAVLVAPASRLAVFRAPSGLEMIIRQVRDIGVPDNINISAATAVTSVRAALRLILGPAEAEAPVAALARFQCNVYLVVKHAPFLPPTQAMAILIRNRVVVA